MMFDLSVHKLLRKTAMTTLVRVESMATFNHALFSGTVAEYIQKNEPIEEAVVEIRIENSTLVITALD